MNIKAQDIFIRLLLAIVMGGIIGYEREVKHRAAGFRTHILVCIGATLISILQISIGNKAIEMIGISKELSNVIKVDYGRLGAQVISGVGFLGAGAILHTKGSIKGLTTAASLWIVACLGLAIGMGEYVISIVTFILIIITLVAFKTLELKFMDKVLECKVEIKYLKNMGAEEHIQEVFKSLSIKIVGIEFIHKNQIEKNVKTISVVYTIAKSKHLDTNKMLYYISNHESIILVNHMDMDC